MCKMISWGVGGWQKLGVASGVAEGSRETGMALCAVRLT